VAGRLSSGWPASTVVKVREQRDETPGVEGAVAGFGKGETLDEDEGAVEMAGLEDKWLGRGPG
jgi:hypothetical protein